MNRNHKVFTITIVSDVPVMIPDPPGSGEMRRTGEIVREPRKLTIIATSKEIALAWMNENPYRYPNCTVSDVVEAEINAVIETHTY